MPPRTLRTRVTALHELVFRVFFRLAAAGGSVGQLIAYGIYFGWVHRRPDAWQYATSADERSKYARTLEAIGVVPANRVLEAGCCEGVFTEQLLRASLARQVVGVDISSQALSRARVRCATFTTARFERANLAFDAPSGFFDLIICAETLYYLGPRFADGCLLMRARLARGGRIVAVHPADRAEALHAPWTRDASLVRERQERVNDVARPYVIEVFRLLD